MSWVKIDDGFPDHPKVVRLDDAAFRLHVSALCYAARAGTDGFIPESMVPRLHHTGPKLVDQLLAAGLWHRREGGFTVHDFLDYNLSKAEGEALRKKRAAAGQLGGRRSGESRRSSTDEANDEANAQALASEGASSKPEANANPVPVPVFEKNVESEHSSPSSTGITSATTSEEEAEEGQMPFTFTSG